MRHWNGIAAASVATLPMVFGIIPECRSASSRIQHSALPESPQMSVDSRTGIKGFSTLFQG